MMWTASTTGSSSRSMQAQRMRLGAVSIDGTTHYDFSDLPLLSPLAPQLGLKGPINGKRVTPIVNDYLLSFFEMTLQGKASDLFAPGRGNQ